MSDDRDPEDATDISWDILHSGGPTNISPPTAHSGRSESVCYTVPSPISCVPEDVLTLIFLNLARVINLDEKKSTRSFLFDPRKLVPFLTVCRRWYNVMMSTPRLWASLSTHWGNATDDLLQRAGEAPLSFEWTSYLRRVFLVNNHVLKSRIEQLAHRFQTVILCIDLETYNAIKGAFPTSFDLLVELTFTPSYGGGGWSASELSILRAPKLRVLHLQALVIPDLGGLYCPLLTVLHLSPAGGPCKMTLLALLSLLSHTPLMESIEISVGSTRLSPSEVPDDRIIALPCLKYMRLYFHPEMSPLQRLLPHIALAKPCKLNYSFWPPPLNDWSSVFSSFLLCTPTPIFPQRLRIAPRGASLFLEANDFLPGAFIESLMIEVRMPANGRAHVIECLELFHQNTCDLHLLQGLRCEAVFLADFWADFVGSKCTTITTLEVEPGNLRFLAGALCRTAVSASEISSGWTQSPPELYCLPSLAKLVILESRQPTAWADLLPPFTSALEARALVVDRPTSHDRSLQKLAELVVELPDQATIAGQSWKDDDPCIRRLRTVVQRMVIVRDII